METIGPLDVKSESTSDGPVKSENKTTASWEKNKKPKKGKMAAKKKAGNPKKNKKKKKSTASQELTENDNQGRDEADEEGKDAAAGEEDDSEAGSDEGVQEAAEEEDDWKRLQKTMKKQKAVQEARKESHPVHAPLFPAVRSDQLL